MTILHPTPTSITCVECGIGIVAIPATGGSWGQSESEFARLHATCGRIAGPAPEATDYCYSTNQEYYTGGFASREDALAEAIAEKDEDGEALVVWTAISTPAEVGACFGADDVLEHLGDRASDDAIGTEFGDDWPPSVKGEALDELKAIVARFNAAIDAWVARRCPPTWFGVRDVQRHDVEAPDGRSHPGADLSPGGPVTQNGADHPAIPEIPKIPATARDPRDGGQS